MSGEQLDGAPRGETQATHLCVANISLALTGDDVDQFSFPAEMLSFWKSTDGPADIEVDADWVDRINGPRTTPHFDSGAVWTLFREGSSLWFDFCSPVLGQLPYKRLLANRVFNQARLLLSREALDLRCPISPLEYPTDELLFTNYLAAHGLGVEVHGCGLVDAETGGHLLLGHSGAGKSTTARLWQSLRNPEILSDDRIILRIENGELWMYGTPWHGEGQFASPGKAKLDRILILQHDKRNQLIEMSHGRAAAELFARSFPPFHSSEGLQNVMDFLNRVVNIVPCYEFGFVPDATAVETVIEMEHAAVA